MPVPLKDRPYWPKLPARVEQRIAAGDTNAEISMAISEEFDLRRESFWIAVRRGDVPAMQSRDKARAQARKRGDVHFEGKPCVTCENRTRYVSDLRCLTCEQGYSKAAYANRNGVTD